MNIASTAAAAITDYRPVASTTQCSTPVVSRGRKDSGADQVRGHQGQQYGAGGHQGQQYGAGGHQYDLSPLASRGDQLSVAVDMLQASVKGFCESHKKLHKRSTPPPPPPPSASSSGKKDTLPVRSPLSEHRKQVRITSCRSAVYCSTLYTRILYSIARGIRWGVGYRVLGVPYVGYPVDHSV